MDMKRILVFVVLGIFMVSMMGEVLAITGTEAGAEVSSFVTHIKDFLETVFGEKIFDGDSNNVSLFLFAILVGMFVYSSVVTFMGEGVSSWIATGAITIMAVFAFPTDLIEVIKTQYAVMGTTFLTVTPFLVILFFTIKLNNSIASGVIWIFYSLYYLWMFILGVINGTGNRMAYFLAFLGGIIMFVWGIDYVTKWMRKEALKNNIERMKSESELLIAQRNQNVKEAQSSAGGSKGGGP